MLPNWVYYFLGKKSGGEPTPPEPPEPPTPQEKPYIPNNTMTFRNSALTLTNLQYLLENIDFNQILNYNYFFQYCADNTLITIDVSSITPVDKISGLTEGFRGCTKTKTIKLWNEFDTSTIRSFYNCFLDCTVLEDIYGIEKMNFSNITNSGLNTMFTRDDSLSNSTLLNIAKALLTVPNSNTNKKLNYIGLSQTQAEYIANNSSDWTTLQTNGWITGY